MACRLETEYISVGGNRHSAAADWLAASNVLAFGADQNVALWQPLSDGQQGVSHLLRGHTGKVTAAKFLTGNNRTGEGTHLITGCADGEIRGWRENSRDGNWDGVAAIKAHDGAVNCIAVLGGNDVFVSGGADAVIRVWRLEADRVTPLLTIQTKPRFIPLSLALGSFVETPAHEAMFLAAGGTRNDIKMYSLYNLSGQPEAKLCATLSGHEGWIRSLALQCQDDGGALLASASHDKYVRLWKFSNGSVTYTKKSAETADLNSLSTTLTAKVQTVSVPGAKLSITFEALLLGHEDWVYSAAWNPRPKTQQLLTASADGSLAIWEPDLSSGIWVSASRLGEISGQKGATTATGSAGGFWMGLWSPTGQEVVCLGRTGGWRLWRFDETLQYWAQRTGITGHISPVNDLTWSPDGSYLLSTSSDQTTRLHAEWRRGTKRSWHEFARPQIHGYDLNCIASNSIHQFSSGADEKLLRVFDEPKVVAGMLEKLCRIEQPLDSDLPETAAMPVLGLSNKAENETAESNGHMDDDADTSPADATTPSLLDLNEPPTEDILARHTLWPEHEKLYGHGYEISAAAASGDVLATACKASSVDHAVIRLYDTTDWNEIKPPLSTHSLTVTRLVWSNCPENLLLSVGRDRQWAVFQQPRHQAENNTKGGWKLLQSNQKAHTRMILDAAWSPPPTKGQYLSFFATAGRDKAIKIWQRERNMSGHDGGDSIETNTPFELVHTIPRKSAVTALSMTAMTTNVSRKKEDEYVCLAAGEDDGTISLHVVALSNNSNSGDKPNKIKVIETVEVAAATCPSKTVTRLAWRPKNFPHHSPEYGLAPGAQQQQLGVASMDSSTRVLSIDVGRLRSSQS